MMINNERQSYVQLLHTKQTIVQTEGNLTLYVSVIISYVLLTDKSLSTCMEDLGQKKVFY